MDEQNDGGWEQQYYQGAPPYHQAPPPPPRRGLSRRGWVLLGVALGLLALGVLVGAGFLVDRVLFPPEKSKEFVLSDSTSYQEALFDIRDYYLRDYSESDIKDAAQKAVEEEKGKGEKSKEVLLDVGLSALTEALGDDHSIYLTPGENKRLSEDLSGSFFGVGFTLRVNEDEERPEVVSVIEGSPSEKAGVKAGDIITAVDGEDTKGQSLDGVVLRIRGKKGTDVTLDVKRPKEDEDLTFKITRDKIEIPDFESEIIDGRYGVLRVFEHNKGIAEKIREAVRDMQEKGVQGFMLDLRNNPGGLLDEAVKTVSIFVNDGTVVSYQTKGHDRVDEPAQGNALTDLPLVVLVNEGSASSSEIVAGALRDLGRAVLVGTKTFGKGSVQKMYDLDNDGALKLTVSLYYLPDGESIEGEGIEPEVVVKVEDDLEAQEQQQFDRAKKILQNLIEGKPATGAALRPAA
ncbi:MAG: S41 family peptidase [Actinomycetia bacterium]|nr:S41 family peptidase [Actinomycetota bacterium]MCG2794556.1 S41 family peptidase [Actinomycetes bacterium]